MYIILLLSLCLVSCRDIILDIANKNSFGHNHPNYNYCILDSESFEHHSSWTPMWNNVESYFRFNEQQVELPDDFIDCSSLNHRITQISGDPLISNRSLSLDGSSYISIDSAHGSGTQDNFSISVWVKASSPHQIDTESNSGTAGTSGQSYVIFPRHTGMNNIAGVGFSVGTNGISVYEHTNSYMPAKLVYSDSIGADWNHIALVYQNKTPHLYLNGTHVKTGLQSTKQHVELSRTIGGGFYGGFNGEIDELIHWRATLSADQVNQIYQRQKNNF